MVPSQVRSAINLNRGYINAVPTKHPVFTTLTAMPDKSGMDNLLGRGKGQHEGSAGKSQETKKDKA